MDINKLKDEFKITAGKPDKFEMIIKKENGEIIYQNTNFGGVLCVVEEIQEINYDEYSIVGTQQELVWGKIVHWQHCFIHLTDFIKDLIGKS